MTRAEKAERNKAMREYKSQGHTMQEVADKFGVVKGTAQIICKGIAPQKPDLKGKARNQWTSIDFKLREQKAIETVDNHLSGFEYAGGFTHSDGSVQLKCKGCGLILTRSLIGIRHDNGVRCPNCARLQAEENEKQKQYKRALAKRERDRCKLLSINYKQVSFKVCAECGELFYPKNINNVCCSPKCSKKRNNRKKDTRINSGNTIDKDITLTKLYERDKGVCYLCGSRCDWNDKQINEYGATIVGETYPTIEHVVPLCDGGMHSWSNIKLACHKCNSFKNRTPLVNFLERKIQ